MNLTWKLSDFGGNIGNVHTGGKIGLWILVLFSFWVPEMLLLIKSFLVVSGSLETHISCYSKEAPPWLRYHTVAKIKKDDFIRCEKHWKTLSIGAFGCAWTPWISFPGRAKLPWNLLLRSLEVIPVGVGLMSWQVFTSGCLLSSAMARLPETGAGWFQQRRCSVATGASGFEFHHFENGQTMKSFTSFAVILSKRAWLRGRHARPYLSSNALSVFSLDLRETLAVLVFSRANRFRIPVWNTFAWMLFKIMFATFDSTVQSRVFICFSCLRMSCSRCLMSSIFYTSKHMTPKKHHFQDSRQYRDFAPKEGF